MSSPILQLIKDIQNCTACADELPCGPRPIVAASESAKIVIIGQAPGIRVHESGIPWNDPSGQRLREWMSVSKEEFYDESKIALVPMGFCYPGTGPSGDLPPRPECADLWHQQLFEQLHNIELTLLVGQYAQKYRLGSQRKATLTKTVEAWQDFAPAHLPLPHPSPRNNRWLKKNPWFAETVLPYLSRQIRKLLS